MYLLNGVKVLLHHPRTIGATQYPEGWFNDPAERAKVGMTEVADIIRPDLSLFDSTENANGTWTSTPRDPALIAAEVKVRLNVPILAQLAANDLSVIRAVTEGNTARITAHLTAQAALRARLL